MIKLIDLFIFFTANIGLAYIVTQSVLLEEPREKISNWLYARYTWNPNEKQNELYRTLCLKLDYLITCIICASVWTSILLYTISNNFNLIQFSGNLYDLLLLMLMAPTITIIFNETFLKNNTEE